MVESRVKTTFSSIAHRYDVTNSVLSLGLHKLWKKKLVKLLPDFDSPFVLDLCCGTGDITLLLSRKYSDGKVIGIDFCDEMLGLAEERKKSRSNISFRKANALSLPFSENSFHVVTVGFGMRNIANRKRALEESLRVLKKGGVFASLEFAPSSVFIFPPLYRFYLNRVLPAVGGLITGDRMAYHYLASSIEAYYEPEEFAELMKSTGFKKVSYRLLGSGAVAIHQGFKE